ncbi:MAG: hypothetical protein C4K58_02625 [Flavobacteriaceae bacterium]|nr:MAG: hypothetical protein C4K58_02625 [Flavobacteriaceae bacterium]
MLLLLLRKPIIDKATPIKAQLVYPEKGFNRIVGIISALSLSLLVLLIIELFDTRINVTSDVTNFTKIPVLGAIGRNLHPFNTVVIEKPKSRVSEAFRILRAGLKTLLPTKVVDLDANQTYLITSSIGGEGKTFVSVNLASVLALSGKKTLLMGLDLRKPKIYDDFNINKTDGLTNYLSQGGEFKNFIFKTKLEYLDVMPAGAIPPNPLELLMSSKFAELMVELKKEYHYIVMDTAPSLLVADALELMKFADASIYVTRHKVTERGFLSSINQKYLNKEVENIGIIINDFSVEAGYGNQYGYAYGYGYGYFEEDAKYERTWVEKIKDFFQTKLKRR